jgi:peptidoglycan DL-endopeptidase CwlO
MKIKMLKLLGTLGFCTCLSFVSPVKTFAAEVAVETSTTLYAKMDESMSVKNAAQSAGAVITQALEGQTYEVVQSLKDGWLKIKTPDGEGYVSNHSVTMIEKTQEKVDESVILRQRVVDYSLQFLGGRYVYGGANPNTGVDCSGFTRYVLKNAAGVNLSHSSRAQAGEGQSIHYEQLRPGDLVFYAKHGSINHVALYIGDGKVINASNRKTGIIVKNIMYRQPVRYVSVLNNP